MDGAAGGELRTSGSCVTLTPAVYRSSLVQPGLDLTVPPGGLALTARGGPADLSLRRFAAAFPPAPLGSVSPGGTAILRIPPDRADQPWHVHVAPAGRLTACGLGGQG